MKQLHPAPTGQVGTSDAVQEQTVATEQQMFSRAVEADSTLGVARCSDDLKLVTAPPDDLPVGQFPSYRWTIVSALLVENEADLVCDAGIKLPVTPMHLGQKAVSLADERIAEHVVEMSVCAKQMFRHEFMAGDVVTYFVLFLRTQGAAVDDKCFARFVGNDIAVFLYHVDYKSLNRKHLYIS